MDTEQEPFWKLARNGVTLLLNNKQIEADILFKQYPDVIQMYSGYATSTFMEALMTFEDDKLNLASQTLKETERRCSASGWFKTVKDKSGNEEVTYAEHLEMQIIRADSEMYLATLTFLQQDISAYFKGGWILRKSWKHYQQTYNEILSLYKQIVGEALPDYSASQPFDVVSSTIDMGEDGSGSVNSTNPTAPISSDMEIFDKNELLHSSSESSIHTVETPEKIIRNGYIPKSHTTQFLSPGGTDSSNTTIHHQQQNHHMKKSQSVNSALARYNSQLQKNLARLSSPINSSLSYISSFNPFSTEGLKTVEIDKETITRLMCGVSFGYGLLQLGMSLLPPSILKLTNFLGFQGNRKSGLSNLMYARSGSDMRAPMATLALLWYHTIVRPFFALDGNNVQAGVHAAAGLIDDAMVEYSNSSIFLFFKGRVDRLKSDIPAAINSFNASVKRSNQREIKILSQHEVGWCYLIQLDYKHSYDTFLSLKQQSRWSRAFYMYLCTISAGSNSTIHDVTKYEEFLSIFSSSPTGSQLDEFLARRFKICPTTEAGLQETQPFYWRMLIYELLYLWNSLPSCNYDNIKLIIDDCEDGSNRGLSEPFVGLTCLIAGSAYSIMKDYSNSEQSFRNCVEKRKSTSFQADDAYISAFALYELGQLLIKNPDTKLEGKQCLQQIHNYKDYDFEQRLSSDIPAAINSFNASVKRSNQREIKILSQHEVGWCYLIQLDYKHSYDTFLSLKQQSRWSRAFYMYLCTISAGSNSTIHDVTKYEEFLSIFSSSPTGSQLDEFLARRFKICPTTEAGLQETQPFYWRMLIYELLYLWNSLPSCNYDNIKLIIDDCEDGSNRGLSEPFVGLTCLIAGSAYSIMKDYSNSEQSFRNCVEKRKSTSFQADDAYISAFALYELGQLLIKNPDTKLEGKQCLQQIHNYKDYDFEQRLSSDIPAAINSFNASVKRSNQREIKILSQHEVGWCYLIQLDYKHSYDTFLSLKQQSRWSRAFYMYLCTISAGSNSTIHDVTKYEEFLSIFSSSPTGSQLDEFLARRFKICPTTEAGLQETQPFYWRMLIYELLYLWNSLPSCNYDNIKLIIDDCEDGSNRGLSEPFVGLTCLIAGSAYSIMKDYSNSEQSFRNCVEKRKSTSFQADDAYISAFALYELGQLLIKNPDTKLEGKQCLQQIHNYKDYDFEQRLSSDIPAAINSFNASVKRSNQREIKILSQHEVGWCYLIQLDYKHSYDTFLSLKQQSRWSRAFYMYLCTISAGSNSTIHDVTKYEEFLSIFSSSPTGSQLDEFLARRFKICPTTEAGLQETQPFYWRMLIYELLYLWNSLPSCNYDNIKLIIDDCEDGSNRGLSEPFVGLTCLIAGSAYSIMKDYSNSEQSFRNCVEKRKSTSFQADDAYISAFALYELGQLLIKNPDTKLEGKQCLQQIHNYKDYDFEQRLSVRIHSILKHL